MCYVSNSPFLIQSYTQYLKSSKRHTLTRAHIFIKQGTDSPILVDCISSLSPLGVSAACNSAAVIYWPGCLWWKTHSSKLFRQALNVLTPSSLLLFSFIHLRREGCFAPLPRPHMCWNTPTHSQELSRSLYLLSHSLHIFHFAFHTHHHSIASILNCNHFLQILTLHTQWEKWDCKSFDNTLHIFGTPDQTTHTITICSWFSRPSHLAARPSRTTFSHSLSLSQRRSSLFFSLLTSLEPSQTNAMFERLKLQEEIWFFLLMHQFWFNNFMAKPYYTKQRTLPHSQATIRAQKPPKTLRKYGTRTTHVLL